MSHESLPQHLSDQVDTLKDAASDLKEKVSDAAARQRTNAAKGLNRAASAIHDKAEKIGNSRVSGAAHKVADGIDSTATYLEENDFSDMGEDAMNVARRHPGKAILASLAVGFLLGRVLRR
jgi:ElaB/YqjD/DUF883 family membrane-anchored ribosome-binding protein